jgi:hypothetical protein
MPFQKGVSGNPAGRRRSFDTLRALAQEILNEDDGGITRVEKILRGLIVEDPKKLLEIGFGKVPDELVSDNVTHITVTYSQGDPNGKSSNDTDSAQEATGVPEDASEAKDNTGG